MSDHEYSQGICQDGAAILKDGVPMTPEEIITELERGQASGNSLPATLENSAMNLELISEMYDASVRAETIIHLGTMAWDEEGASEILTDEFESDPEPLLEATGLDRDAIYELFEFSEALRDERKSGWLVKFSTPVPASFDARGNYSFSWGYYTSKWMYGDDYEQLCREALQWQSDFVQRRRQKAQPS